MPYTPLGRLRIENGERAGFVAATTTPPIVTAEYGRGMLPSIVTPTIVTDEYGRGFIPPPATPTLTLDIVREMQPIIAPLIHPVQPIAPIPAPATVIEPFVRPPVMPSQVVPPTVYEPTFVRDNTAFERAEALKYGYSVQAWIGMGATARCRVRRLYAEEGPPTTRDGTPIRAVAHTVVAGPDPIRQRYQEVGAGDHGGFEFREPESYYPIRQTVTGLEFVGPAEVQPIKKVTAPDLLMPGELMKIGLLVAAGLFAYQQFFVKHRPRRRRRHPAKTIARYERHKTRFRPGWQ